MKSLTIPYPDDFTADEVDFLKRSCVNQVVAISNNKFLVVPDKAKTDAKAVEDAVKVAAGLSTGEEPAEPK